MLYEISMQVEILFNLFKHVYTEQNQLKISNILLNMKKLTQKIMKPHKLETPDLKM